MEPGPAQPPVGGRDGAVGPLGPPFRGWLGPLFFLLLVLLFCSFRGAAAPGYPGRSLLFLVCWPALGGLTPPFAWVLLFCSFCFSFLFFAWVLFGACSAAFRFMHLFSSFLCLGSVLLFSSLLGFSSFFGLRPKALLS